MNWFLACLNRSLDSTDILLTKVLDKAKFWDRFSTLNLNERQIKILNKLLDGFEGKLTSSKWATLTKCSQDTALRDIQDLISKNVLIKEMAGGRSTSYILSMYP
jgi:Fic family protein